MTKLVFTKGVDANTVVLMAARAASRLENQDAKEGWNSRVHFLTFNPTDKRTALTYIVSKAKMLRVSKGAPEQILNLAYNRSEIEQRMHAVIGKFVGHGLRSLGVAYQRKGRRVLEVHGSLQDSVLRLLEGL